MIHLRFYISLRFVWILALVSFVLTLTIWLFAATAALAVPCCKQQQSQPACLSPGFQQQDCPNGDDPPSYCWIEVRECESSIDCDDCWYITYPGYCRTNCDDNNDIVRVAFGCGETPKITTEWEEWDLNNPRNSLLACTADLCFCDEDDECTGYTTAYKEIAEDGCND